VHLFRSPSLAPEIAQSLAEGLKTGLAVSHAQVARGFEAGRIDRTAFAAFEFFEGRPVAALLERSQAERHPFAADHALLIVSKAAAALEAAQAKKAIHGFLVPEFIHVSHDGEVSVRGFGLPPRVLRDANCVGAREARFLAPEVNGNTPLDIRADIFSLGAQLFEMLTASALPRPAPTARSVAAALIHSPGGDGTPIPKPLAALLAQALAEEPGQRFKDASAFKKAVDTLLFSGDYSPTTFNLAFFMHTLFRDEGDEDAARISAERLADYRPYLAASEVRPPVPPSAPPGTGPVRPGAVATPSQPPDATLEVGWPELSKVDSTRRDSGRTARIQAPAGHPPASDQLFQTMIAEGDKKAFPVAAVVAGVLVVASVAGYLLTRTGSPPSAPKAAAPTMNAAESAALTRVRELESRLAALEAEKVAAEQTAAEEAKRIIEAQARARGRSVDPAELQKAQDAARRKAQSEQEERLQAERKKIEDERRLAEETRAAEAAKAATPSPTVAPVALVMTPAPSPSATPPTSPTPFPSPTPLPVATLSAPADSSGGAALLDLEDPGVVPPRLISQARIEYPRLARAQRITGTVLISALVDEQGKVAEARIIRGAAESSGLNLAAIENVKLRRYKPATLNGKPGRAWVTIQIDFKL
jgi:TonB family protein